MPEVVHDTNPSGSHNMVVHLSDQASVMFFRPESREINLKFRDIHNGPGRRRSPYSLLLSRVNQNSTPFSQFVTPHSWLWASMIAFTMDKPIPVPP